MHMKRMTLSVALGLALIAGQAKAQNNSSESLRVWIDDITVRADGQTATRLTVYENDTERDYTAFNMSLIVPAGISVKQVKKGRVYVNSIELSERAAETHTISCNMPEPTLLKIICTSNQNDDFYPDDEDGTPLDELFYIDLIADPTMVNGTYNVQTEGVIFGQNIDGQVTGFGPEVSPSFNLTITGGQDALSVPYTLSAAGVGTLCLPFDADVPEGLTVHTASSVVGARIQMEAQTNIRAGIPLIVTGEPGNYTFRGMPSVTGTEFTDGVLTGVTASRQLAGGYVLQTLNSVTGFYRVSSEQPVTMPAYRAWLNYDEAGVKMVSIDISTGLSGAGQANGNADQYDLSGRRVQQPTRRGIYVQQGKKRLKTDNNNVK